MELEKLTQKIIKGIFVELEASGRHVHVNEEQAQILFGHGLTPPQTPFSAVAVSGTGKSDGERT